MVEMEHRVTVLESDVATLKENRAEDRIMLSAIQKFNHCEWQGLGYRSHWIRSSLSECSRVGDKVSSSFLNNPILIKSIFS